MAKTHGQLISLRLGSRLVIVGSSSEAATEILKNKDRFLSGRLIPKCFPCKTQVLERIALVWNPTCSTHWKSFRTICRTELFSAKAIESQTALREKKMVEMIEYLRSKEGVVVNIGEIVFATVFNIISNLLFSKDLISFENHRLKNLLRRLMELCATPNLADFYPIFAELDLQGLRRESAKCVEEMFGIWEIDIKERRETYTHNKASNADFLDVFLSNGFDDDQINWLVMELYSGGVDTSTSTIEWAIAELLKNKEAMTKLEQEIELEFHKNPINESKAIQLPYLNACLKETLRLHPPVPLLIPHRSTESCQILNFTIPENSQILLNVWAIGRDPSVWKDPLVFKPERFLELGLDFKTQDFGFLPFGSGRRICPGLPMAVRQLPFILGSLIQCFDWCVPNGAEAAVLDMGDKFGVTLQKETPLLLLPKPKDLVPRPSDGAKTTTLVGTAGTDSDSGRLAAKTSSKIFF